MEIITKIKSALSPQELSELRPEVMAFLNDCEDVVVRTRVRQSWEYMSRKLVNSKPLSRQL